MNGKRINGFSLVEVLIAFVILVIGLLGATTLVIRSSQANMRAYETEQVALVVSSFVEKIRVNNVESAMTEYTNTSNENVADCINVGCDADKRAKTDKYVFQEQLDALSLANENPTWTFTKADDATHADYYVCDLIVKWGVAADDTKNSYRANFMIKKVP